MKAKIDGNVKGENKVYLLYTTQYIQYMFEFSKNKLEYI